MEANGQSRSDPYRHLTRSQNQPLILLQKDIWSPHQDKASRRLFPDCDRGACAYGREAEEKACPRRFVFRKRPTEMCHFSSVAFTSFVFSGCFYTAASIASPYLYTSRSRPTRPRKKTLHVFLKHPRCELPAPLKGRTLIFRSTSTIARLPGRPHPSYKASRLLFFMN